VLSLALNVVQDVSDIVVVVILFDCTDTPFQIGSILEVKLSKE
jgi:hypothetical protein